MSTERDLSKAAQEVLLRVYIGQNIREYGILQGTIREKREVQELLENDLIREDSWYRHELFLTTDEGSQLGKQVLSKRMSEKESKLRTRLDKIPERSLNFLVRRHINGNLDVPGERPIWLSSWKDYVLADGRIWILWERLFGILEDLGLCTRTRMYVSTRGGEVRGMRYVISPEVREHLASCYSGLDLDAGDLENMKVYSLLSADLPFHAKDVEYVRQTLYQKLKETSVRQEALAAVINEMNTCRITSRFRGFLAEEKPFDVTDESRFRIFLEENLKEPTIRTLLGREEPKGFIEGAPAVAVWKPKTELGIVDRSELGAFYVEVSDLEIALRDFIRERIRANMGKNWLNGIRKNSPKMIDNWEERSKTDRGLGIEPEVDLTNYADLEDYRRILRWRKKLFFDNDEEMGNVYWNLTVWYNYGRNPIMHSRTVNLQKLIMTRSAISYLYQWMSRHGRILATASPR